jgi:hypothetical protein
MTPSSWPPPGGLGPFILDQRRHDARRLADALNGVAMLARHGGHPRDVVALLSPDERERLARSARLLLGWSVRAQEQLDQHAGWR